jgi:hypothetical protein
VWDLLLCAKHLVFAAKYRLATLTRIGIAVHIANALRRMRHERAQAQTRAGVQTPHPSLRQM